MTARKSFQSFDEYFAFYMEQHASFANRLLHAVGTALGILVVVLGLVSGYYWLALLWVPVGYGFAWLGHLAIEHNRPATWDYPLWSFISDFRMLGLMLTGRLGPWLERAKSQSGSA